MKFVVESIAILACLTLCLMPENVLATISYKTYYFEQPIDHFSFASSHTFQERFLLADQYWNRNGGPIFFYAGNEGDITWFCNNTGFMWEIAPQFQALLVFAEHRYYGESMPYGNLSYSDIEHLGYLSSEQALADFAELLLNIRGSLEGAGDSPIIAFGGSYGGMLAAWMRIKYPHVVQGAIASSAPILQFTGITPCNIFNLIVTKDFKMRSTECAKSIRKSWDVINLLNETAEGKKFLTTTFHLCKPLETAADILDLKNWLNGVYGNLAMVEYPYPASFLEPLPAWPIKEVCRHLPDSSQEDHDLMISLFKAVSVYFNYTGDHECLDTSQKSTSDLGDLGWNFQACSEMVMPMCADGVNDMFEPIPWDFDAFSEDCFQNFKVRPRKMMAPNTYGGRNISAASNIIFSNGGLDPWSGGGVTTSISDSLVAIVIPEGAHHLDLRSSNPADPASVIKARKLEVSHIIQWIKEYRHAVRFGY